MYRVAALVLLSTVLAVASLAPLRPLAEASPNPAPVATGALTYNFQILTSRSQIETVGSTLYYVVEGVVKNTGSANATEVYVRAKLFSALGPELKEGSGRILLDIVAAGETSPFRVRIRYPDSLVGRYEVDAVGYETDELPLRDVVLVNDSFQVRDGDRWWYGEWQNNSSRTIAQWDINDPRQTLYVAIPFNAAGQMLDYYFGELYYYINPGTRVPFAAHTSANNPVVRWEYWINYHVLDPGVYGNSALLRDLSLEPTSYGGLTAKATATNLGDKPLAGFYFTVMFRDAQGRVVNWGRPYVFSSTSIAPSQSAQVSGSLYSYEIPTSYQSYDGYVLSEYTTSIQPPTPTPSPTLPATVTLTPSPTQTPSPTLTPTMTATPTYTSTPTPSLTATVTPSPTITPTSTSTPIPTATLRPTPDGGYPYSIFLPLLQVSVDI